MHMSDALLSAPVALAADVVAAALLAVAAVKVKKNTSENSVALMGVMGAFVFAAQMLNFAIPGTGSSGHIVGGILLASVLGPWAAFITLSSVLIIQCLVFADGGLMALGCNIINMGALTTLVAYPLVFRPLLKFPAPAWKLMTVSILASVVGLELGACAVTLETMASGITALPAAQFFTLMTAIHLAIGAVEGIATGLVLIFVQRTRPALLGEHHSIGTPKTKRALLWGFGIAALIIGGGLAFFASSDPDGLEWSIGKVAGTDELAQEHVSALSVGAQNLQDATSIMPDYDNSFAGIAGAVMVLLLVWLFTSLLVKRKRSVEPQPIPIEENNPVDKL